MKIHIQLLKFHCRYTNYPYAILLQLSKGKPSEGKKKSRFFAESAAKMSRGIK